MRTFLSLLVAIFVFAITCLAHAAPPATQPATQPTKLAAERADMLKKDLQHFTLALNYFGEEDKPYYRLFLSVPPIPIRRKTPFAQLDAQITEDQATKIINYLALEGFLDRATIPLPGDMPPPPTPLYVMSSSGFFEYLGWGLPMLHRLDALRTVLDGDAAKNMDTLLARLSGHRTEWNKASAEANAAWQAVLQAMQAGDKTALAKATTAKGYKSLISDRAQEFTAENMRAYAANWANVPLRFDQQTESAASASLGPDSKPQGLEFLKTPEGWKLDQWRPGL